MCAADATLLIDAADDRGQLERNHPLGGANVRNFCRHVAIQGGPRFIWISEFASPEALADALAWDGSQVVPGVPALRRRVYRPRGESFGSDAEAAGCQFLGASSMSVEEKDDVELNAWYLDEHIPGLLKIDGWARSRRFELVAGQGPKHLALHDMRDLAVREHADFHAIMTTPWRRRIMEMRTEYDRKLLSRET